MAYKWDKPWLSADSCEIIHEFKAQKNLLMVSERVSSLNSLWLHPDFSRH